MTNYAISMIADLHATQRRTELWTENISWTAAAEHQVLTSAESADYWTVTTQLAEKKEGRQVGRHIL